MATTGLTTDPAQVMAGYKPKSGLFSKTDFLTVDAELNAYTKKNKQIGTPEEKLLRSMVHGIDEFMSDRFPDLFKSLPTTLHS